MFEELFLIIFISVCLLSTRNIKYGILFIIITTPFNLLIKIFLGMSLFSKIWHNLLILLLCLFIFARSAISTNYSIKLNKLDIAIIGVLLYGIFSVFYSYLIMDSWFVAFQGFRLYYFGILLYFITRFYIKRLTDVRTLIAVIIGVILISSLELIAEFALLNLQIISPEDLVWIGGLPELYAGFYGQGGATTAMFADIIRPWGIFYHMQYSSAFTLIGVLMSLPFFVFSNKISYNPLDNLFLKPKFFYVSFVALFLSTARTAIFAFLLTSLFMFTIYKIFNKKLLIITMLFVMLVIINFKGFTEVYIKEPLLGKDIHIKETALAIMEIPVVLQRSTITSFLFGDGFKPDPYAKETLGIISFDDKFSGLEGGSEGILSFFYEVGFLGIILFILQNISAYKRSINITKREIPNSYQKLLIGLSFVILGIFFSSVHVMPITAAGIQYVYYIILGIIGSFNVEWFKVKRNEVAI